MAQFKEDFLTPVKFHKDTVFLVQHEGQPYVPLRPVVENLGLAWQAQHRKLMDQKTRWSVTIMVTVAGDGKTREMVAVPLRKFFAFLNSIEPSKVKPTIRQKLEDYQEKCDEVLWNYWSGQYQETDEEQRLRRIIREELASFKIPRKVRAPLDQEEIGRLKSDILSGAGTTETARKYGLGTSTVKRYTVAERATRQLPLLKK